ncbi:fimbria major subunit, partial [Bacteroides caccae]|uniref:fimbria major subunit n=1 Tax=Bacteroides caccae TaxID=47678 RepID=UPI00122F0020
IHNYEYKDFRIGENDNTLYLKDGIPVSAGEASIYVILNLQGEPTTPYASMTASANYVSTLDGLTGYVAKPGAFLMSNEKGEVKTVTVKAGEVATARINVERAAAKLVEQSKTTAFENITPGIYGKKLNITLRQYSFVNLQQDTYVLANTTPIESNFFQAYDAAKATWDYVSKDIVGNVQESTPDANSNITYCLENKDANNTRVVYEAVATWGEETEAATFYVTSENEVYTSFESLAAKFGNMLTANGLTAESKAADFRAAGVPIKMYEDGKCYYTADIYTNTASNKTIVRNNVYKLNVSSITKLGEPTPTPTPDPASLNIEVKVLPWTINLVDIIL